MKNIYYCPDCGGAAIQVDATVMANDQSCVSIYWGDTQTCSNCGHESRSFPQAQVPDDFDIYEDFYEPPTTPGS